MWPIIGVVSLAVVIIAIIKAQRSAGSASAKPSVPDSPVESKDESGGDDNDDCRCSAPGPGSCCWK